MFRNDRHLRATPVKAVVTQSHSSGGFPGGFPEGGPEGGPDGLPGGPQSPHLISQSRPLVSACLSPVYARLSRHVTGQCRRRLHRLMRGWSAAEDAVPEVASTAPPRPSPEAEHRIRELKETLNIGEERPVEVTGEEDGAAGEEPTEIPEPTEPTEPAEPAEAEDVSDVIEEAPPSAEAQVAPNRVWEIPNEPVPPRRIITRHSHQHYSPTHTIKEQMSPYPDSPLSPRSPRFLDIPPKKPDELSVHVAHFPKRRSVSGDVDFLAEQALEESELALVFKRIRGRKAAIRSP